MDIEDKKKLLREVRQMVNFLPFEDHNKLDLICKKLKLYITKIFGESSPYLSEQKNISFRPLFSTDKTKHLSFWKDGIDCTLNLIDTMLEDLELTEAGNNSTFIAKKDSEKQNSNIFIVHGHNDEMKESLARMISKIDLVPIILHEQDTKGRTIIAKFADHSDQVNFAVVLLSADDFAYSTKQKPEDGKLRARQNVILELGFFIGKLGFNRVVALVEQVPNFEFPSDYQGLIYIPYDKGGSWKLALVRELKACDYAADANKL